MASAHVTLRGRFSPGTVVQLVRVDGPHVMRAEGGQVVAEAEVRSNDDGISEVRFAKGVDEGARYFVRGVQDGAPLEVRARGRAHDDLGGELTQAPVQASPVRIGLGGMFDPMRRRTKESPPPVEAAPHLSLHHETPKGTVFRSDTPHGAAHVVDPGEPAPFSRQEDVPDGVVQMSDTRTGSATPIAVGPQRQEDAGDRLQRSATPTGIAQPLPEGGAVGAQREKESSAAKERRGSPGRAAAEPVSGARAVRGASEKQSAERHREMSRPVGEIAAEQLAGTARSDPQAARENTSGLDAHGQPADPDVARAAGIDPADKPAEPVNQSRSARTRSTKAKEK